MNIFEAFSPENVKFIMEGFGVTLKIAFISIFFSFILGTLVGTLRYARVPAASQALFFVVEAIRNLPLLLIIMFVKFALPSVGIRLSTEWAAIVALTIFEAAMISEIVRSGLRSIEKGQIEASRSSGLTYMQTLWHISLPQALRRMVPPMVSQFISLLKDTSLAVVISLPELMHNAQIVSAKNVNYILPVLAFTAILYFGINYLLSILAKRLETGRGKGALSGH